MDIRIMEMMDGARNCVRGITNIHKGENVLLLVDTSGFADPLVIQALAAACQEVGAEVVSAMCREFEPRFEEPPKIIQQAALSSDVVLFVSSHEAIIHSRWFRIAMNEYGARLVPVLATTPDIMASEWARFPTDIYYAIATWVYKRIVKSKTLRVTSPGGTDISCGLSPGHMMGFPQGLDGIPTPPTPKLGQFTMFPAGVFGIMPRHPANGIIVYDALLGFKGMCKQPVKLTVKDGWVVKIEGGDEAKWFQALIDEKKKKGISTADSFQEVMWGLNPKASIERGLEMCHLREGELTRRAGTLHFGIGVGSRGFHWDGILIKPFTVYADKEVIIENARLKALDDPGVREIAQRFGDPTKLLTELP